MFIHGGVGLYGKVDQVPGLFHVATRFFHLYWVPLIPLKSVVVRERKGGDDQTGTPIGLSGKSIVFAWLRLALLLLGMWACVGIIKFGVRLLEGRPLPWPRLGLACLVAALFFCLLNATYRFTRAKPLRALELAREVGVTPEQVAEHFVDWDTLPGLDNVSMLSESEPVAGDTVQMTKDH